MPEPALPPQPLTGALGEIWSWQRQFEITFKVLRETGVQPLESEVRRHRLLGSMENLLLAIEPHWDTTIRPMLEARAAEQARIAVIAEKEPEGKDG
ncbi:hypothetical protein [Microvirga brassicacearum]|uniref:Uncharacterized protein n=1 Tax=Microvirga brassicacearum TaxID=2580413 RepID=A0A5N3PGZ9_9HYPH|nr:hypothetical protein [Microvirga brassicacearum]KAB0269011.1 hypothetical protein FEZ63_02575 [Microvirga brassicacearum]